MSGETAEQQADEEAVGEAETPSRITGGFVVIILAGVAALVMKAVVTAAPYVAYFVAGILACRAWQMVCGWFARRRGAGSEEEQDAAEVDVVAALQSLGQGGRSVLLTELRDEIHAPDTKVVRALLGDAEVPVRPGVRTPAGNGPGVHSDDVPPLSPPVEGPGVGRCLCSSEANANANNDGAGTPGEGFRVVRIGTDGKIIYDPADVNRYHRSQ